jgi:small-conductance mechanosensitive channel
MVDSVVDNWSMRNARRTEIKLELDNTTENDLLDAFLKKISAIIKERNPLIRSHSVFVTEYNRNSILLTIEYFTGNVVQEEYNRIKQEMILSVKTAFQQSGIKMATAGHDINIYNTDLGGSGNFTSQIV